MKILKHISYFILLDLCISIISCRNGNINYHVDGQCDCSKRTFYTDFETKKDLSDIDSITLEKYPKNEYFNSLISRSKGKIIKGKIHVTYPQQARKDEWRWGFHFADSLSSEYDYRLLLTNSKDTLQFDLTRIKFQQVTIGGIIPPGKTEAHISYGCMLDSIRVNGKEASHTIGTITINLD
jgi:hypothetical protein